MGAIIKYTHKKCGFNLKFLAGVGFTLFRMQCEARGHMRNGDWGERWQRLMEQYPEGTATLNTALCFCERCKKYFTEPRVAFYVPKDGYQYEFDEHHKDYVPTYIIDKHYKVLEKEVITCPDCEKEANIIENVSSIPCPVCGEIRRGRNVGNWD